jgi:hypothetical protein
MILVCSRCVGQTAETGQNLAVSGIREHVRSTSVSCWNRCSAANGEFVPGSAVSMAQSVLISTHAIVSEPLRACARPPASHRKPLLWHETILGPCRQAEPEKVNASSSELTRSHLITKSAPVWPLASTRLVRTQTWYGPSVIASTCNSESQSHRPEGALPS